MPVQELNYRNVRNKISNIRTGSYVHILGTSKAINIGGSNSTQYRFDMFTPKFGTNGMVVQKNEKYENGCTGKL